MNPKTKALSEGYLSGAALALQGADTVAGEGLASAAASIWQAGNYQLTGFGTVSSGAMRYKSGSHVDMKSVSMLAGFAYGIDFEEKAALEQLTLGSFVEFGNGSYDTYNSFGNAEIRGEGDSHYLGLGLLGRLDFQPVDFGKHSGNFYLEVSVRVGRMYNDYGTEGLADIYGQRAGYDSHTPYYSLHAGLGFDWKLTDKASLDIYAKYFWTHQQGDSLYLPSGEYLYFEAVNSHRVRVGSRLSYAIHEEICPYVGFACEYEFDGNMSAAINGFAIAEPELRGSTGIVEIGVSVAKFGNMSIDLGLQGYVGQREGITGSAMLMWTF